jgi:uncharacterized protein (TIGR00255 family)
MALISMTGFGRAGGRLSDRLSASIVLRSVNHRYLDIQVRSNLREETPEIDAAVRTVVKDRFKRGRVNVQLNLEWQRAPEVSITVNTEAMREVLGQLQNIAADGPGGAVSPGDVLAIPGLVLASAPATALNEGEMALLSGLVAEAAADTAAMRLQEGEQIGRQIETELAEVTSFADWFEPQMEDLRQRVFDRVREKIGEMLAPEAAVDPDRLAQEAAFLADRADVAEEIVRLRAHLETFTAKLTAGGVVGRTLDFLCQEVHRELNTLGSKCREVGIVERVVDAKTAAERVREQVQNLE